MRAEPTFLICVGATKASTSWLFDYLAAHRDCHLRSIKELHYFDMIYRGNYDRYIRGLARQVARLSSALPGLTGRRAALFRRKLRDVQDWQAIVEARCADLPAYRAYLTEGLGDARLVADVTPGYALLPEGSFRGMAEVGQDSRLLYLLRDPVARLWSHARMIARRRVADMADFAGAARAEALAMIDRIGAGATDREDYAGTITRLNAAVDPRRLYVEFSERLLTSPGLSRLCRWLGIAETEADFSRRVLEGAPLALPGDLRARALVALRPQYDFVARQFPDLPDNWRKTLNEVHA
ncbi:hypothetical protein D2N39_03010 [Gemmobacter lutimaris]|uniref:Sulfotransferase n=1 Tax=Gemmobacter lutimaris TaxID=2306023 RepID=A0A398BSS1_9RHOB|nr:hypothetical protein [Gemmobacter lutimaris]RID93879.1 hypothetical protein D2N39_03010 [Gemmobacter lutimaris]